MNVFWGGGVYPWFPNSLTSPAVVRTQAAVHTLSHLDTFIITIPSTDNLSGFIFHLDQFLSYCQTRGPGR